MIRVRNLVPAKWRYPSTRPTSIDILAIECKLPARSHCNQNEEWSKARWFLELSDESILCVLGKCAPPGPKLCAGKL